MSYVRAAVSICIPFGVRRVDRNFFPMPELVSIQNVHISQRPASLGLRALAFFIDCLLITAYYYAFAAIHPGNYLLIKVLLALLPLFFPMIQEILLGGRTLGKLCVGLRVVNLDGSAPPVWAFMLRNLLLWLDLFGSFGTGVVLLFGTKLHRRWGDLAAGTFVVRGATHLEVASPLRSERRLRFFDPDPDFVPRFSRISLITPRRAALIAEGLNAHVRHAASFDLAPFARRVEKIVGDRRDGETPHEYLAAVLRDYRLSE